MSYLNSNNRSTEQREEKENSPWSSSMDDRREIEAVPDFWESSTISENVRNSRDSLAFSVKIPGFPREFRIPERVRDSQGWFKNVQVRRDSRKTLGDFSIPGSKNPVIRSAICVSKSQQCLCSFSHDALNAQYPCVSNMVMSIIWTVTTALDCFYCLRLEPGFQFQQINKSEWSTWKHYNIKEKESYSWDIINIFNSLITFHRRKFGCSSSINHSSSFVCKSERNNVL